MSVLRTHAVKAVWRRQLWSLLGNPLGYVFVLAFVLIYGGLLFIPAEFFVRNINDLGPIQDYIPWLMAVLIPAIAMGSWASEKELGTEEQLLTLPMTETDILVGKWLAVFSYFTLALLCSLSNVAVLVWLGDPDFGLIAAQYLGWWLAGSVFSAAGVLASCWVGLPAVAFVLGVLICGSMATLIGSFESLDAFNRGVISIGQIGIAVALTIVFVGLSILSLNSRRWQSAYKSIIVGTIATFIGLTLTFLNVSVQLDRAAIDLDVTDEGLSSLSQMSATLLAEQATPVRITAFVSKNLPPELALKGKEVLNLLKLVERSAPSSVDLTIHHPEDSLDDAASLASEHYGLEPHSMVVDTVTGQEQREVYLAAVISSGTRTEKIEYFSPGLSVEYELVRAVRTAALAQKRVVGIAKTDLDMLGGFDYGSRQMRQPWQAVAELKKQYEVRSVNLDVAVGDDVTVLIVPQPSSLSDKGVQNLHDYIWAGRPAMIMEDPMPMFAGPQLGSSQPKTPKQQMMPGQRPPAPEAKPDLNPLLESLGIQMALDTIAWSDFNPSNQFRNVWPKNLVWAFRANNGISNVPFLNGIDTLLFPWPGIIERRENASAKLTIQDLTLAATGSAWGTHVYQDFISRGLFGPQLKQPERHTPASGTPPTVAVEITGQMAHAYGPTTSSPDAKDEETNEPGKGDLSPKPVRVIFIADTDFAHDEFFAFYRNADNRFSDDAIKFLRDLRNVQFISNAVDALSGEKGYLDLRTRRPKPRPLTALVKVLDTAQMAFRDAEQTAQTAADSQITTLKNEFQAKLRDVDKKSGLDENAKNQLRVQIQRASQRRLDGDIRSTERERDLAIRAASVIRKREVEVVRGQVRTMALGLPSAILAIIALLVWVRRRKDEALTIPSSRKRESA